MYIARVPVYFVNILACNDRDAMPQYFHCDPPIADMHHMLGYLLALDARPAWMQAFFKRERAKGIKQGDGIFICRIQNYNMFAKTSTTFSMVYSYE